MSSQRSRRLTTSDAKVGRGEVSMHCGSIVCLVGTVLAEQHEWIEGTAASALASWPAPRSHHHRRSEGHHTGRTHRLTDNRIAR
ncbi:hypothetical protein [Nocardia sp. NPDC004711]